MTKKIPLSHIDVDADINDNDSDDIYVVNNIFDNEENSIHFTTTTNDKYTNDSMMLFIDSSIKPLSCSYTYHVI